MNRRYENPAFCYMTSIIHQVMSDNNTSFRYAGNEVNNYIKYQISLFCFSPLIYSILYILKKILSLFCFSFPYFFFWWIYFLSFFYFLSVFSFLFFHSFFFLSLTKLTSPPYILLIISFRNIIVLYFLYFFWKH